MPIGTGNQIGPSRRRIGLQAIACTGCVILEQGVGPFKTAAGKHGQMIAGAERQLANAHITALGAQVRHRHGADPKV